MLKRFNCGRKTLVVQSSANLQALRQKGQKAQRQQYGHEYAGNFNGHFDAEIVDVLGIGIELPRVAEKMPEQQLDLVGHGANPGVQNAEAPKQAYGLAQLWRLGDVALLPLFANAFGRGFFCSAWIFCAPNMLIPPWLDWRCVALWLGDSKKYARQRFGGHCRQWWCVGNGSGRLARGCGIHTRPQVANRLTVFAGRPRLATTSGHAGRAGQYRQRRQG